MVTAISSTDRRPVWAQPAPDGSRGVDRIEQAVRFNKGWFVDKGPELEGTEEGVLKCFLRGDFG